MAKTQHTNSSFGIKSILLLSASFTVMSGAIIAASLPRISELFADVPHIELLSRLLLTLHAIFIAIFSPLAGTIADKYGRKKLLVGSLLLYGLSGASGALMNSLWGILASRVGLGLAVAGLMTACTTLVADYYQGSERDRFLGLQAAAMSFGGVIFISMGGWLADLSWRGPFLVYALTLPLIPFAHKVIIEPKSLVQQNAIRAQPITRGVASQLTAIYLLILMSMAIFYLAPVQAPFLLEEMVVDISSAKIGIALAAMTLTGAFTSLFFEQLKSKLSIPFLYLLAFSTLGLGYLVIGSANDYVTVATGLTISGIGIGLIMPITNSLVMAITPEVYRGRAMGWISTFVYLGQFLSPLLAQPITSSFSIAWSFSVAGYAVLALAMGFLTYTVTSQTKPS